jgi:hypothetical protein
MLGEAAARGVVDRRPRPVGSLAWPGSLPRCYRRRSSTATATVSRTAAQAGCNNSNERGIVLISFCCGTAVFGVSRRSDRSDLRINGIVKRFAVAFWADSCVAGGRRWHSARGLSPLSLSSQRYSVGRRVRSCVRGQHHQVVSQDSQPDRSLEMLKPAIEAPRQSKRPF